MVFSDRRQAVQSVRVAQGKVDYRECGEGPAIVFAHGLLVASDIWDQTVAALESSGLRCIQPELPMGSHHTPLNAGVDNSPPAAAALLGDFLEVLGLEDAILVGNDSGGALCQLLAAQRPERIGGMVLTNCDIGKTFPPFPYSLLPPLARIPGGSRSLVAALQTRIGRRLAYRGLTREPIPDRTLRRWVRPAAEQAGVSCDLRSLVAGAHRSQTLSAAERLRAFDPPVLFAWGRDDRFFKLSHAEWLARRLPNSSIEPIESARTFVMLDQPVRLAELIEQHAALVTQSA